MTEGTTAPREYLHYMNLFRGYTIISIVLVHGLTRFLDHSLWYYDCLLQILGESTCIFLFISGFLFEYLNYESLTYFQFIRKKSRRLLVPYLFWIIPALILEGTYQKDTIDFYRIIWTLVSGLSAYNGAHWYIQLIFFIFLIAPALHKVFKTSTLFTCILVGGGIFLSLITGRDNCSHCYYGIATIPHMIGFFMLGMTFAKYKELLSKISIKQVVAFLVIGVMICGVQGYMKCPMPETTIKAMITIPEGILMNWLTLNKIFFSTGLLGMFYLISRKVEHVKMLDELAKYSFPIYFSHLYFYLPWILTGRESHGWLLNFIMLSAYMLTGSFLLCYCLKRVRFVNKIIGF